MPQQNPKPHSKVPDADRFRFYRRGCEASEDEIDEKRWQTRVGPFTSCELRTREALAELTRRALDCAEECVARGPWVDIRESSGLREILLADRKSGDGPGIPILGHEEVCEEPLTPSLRIPAQPRRPLHEQRGSLSFVR